MNEPDSEGIDLGESPEGLKAPTEMPSEQSEPMYPTVMLSGDHRLQNIADKGVHRIHARVISRHLPHRHSKHHKVELEIHSIHPQKKRGRPAKKQNDADAERMKQAMGEIAE